MIEPHTVLSPKKRLDQLNVIYINREAGYSIAQMRWDGNLAYGIRWNGNESSPIGNPQSSGHPTWFILPDEVIEPFLKELEENRK